VQDAAGPLGITGLGTAGNQVTLALGAAAQGDTLVSYGYSTEQGPIWVRAADGGGAALVFRGLPVIP
jgi:hypothetical protein